MNTSGDISLDTRTLPRKESAVGVIGSGKGRPSYIQEQDDGIWSRLPKPSLSLNPSILADQPAQVTFPQIAPTSLFSTPFVLQPPDSTQSFFRGSSPASQLIVPPYNLFEPITKEQQKKACGQ